MKDKTALLLDTRLPKLKVLPDSTYETCIHYLGNHILQLTGRIIGGRHFVIVYPEIDEDTEGTGRKKPSSAFNSNNEAVFYGNLIICKHDKNGEDIALTDDDIQHIQKHIKNVVGRSGTHPALINVDRTIEAAALPDADEV